MNKQRMQALPRYGFGAGPLIPGSTPAQAGGAFVKAPALPVAADPGAAPEAMAAWLLQVQNDVAAKSNAAQTQVQGFSSILQKSSSDLAFVKSPNVADLSGWSYNSANQAILTIRSDLSLLKYQANLVMPLVLWMAGTVPGAPTMAQWVGSFKTIQGYLTELAQWRRSASATTSQLSNANKTIASLQAQVNNLTAQLKTANAAAAAAAAACVKK